MKRLKNKKGMVFAFLILSCSFLLPQKIWAQSLGCGGAYNLCPGNIPPEGYTLADGEVPTGATRGLCRISLTLLENPVVYDSPGCAEGEVQYRTMQCWCMGTPTYWINEETGAYCKTVSGVNAEPKFYLTTCLSPGDTIENCSIGDCDTSLCFSSACTGASAGGCNECGRGCSPTSNPCCWPCTCQYTNAFGVDGHYCRGPCDATCDMIETDPWRNPGLQCETNFCYPDDPADLRPNGTPKDYWWMDGSTGHCRRQTCPTDTNCDCIFPTSTPTPIPTPSPTPTSSPTPTPTPIPEEGWFQTLGGDVYALGRIESEMPPGLDDPYFNLADTGLGTGVVSYGGAGADFGDGDVSETGWLAGGQNFSPRSYAYFYSLLGSPSLSPAPENGKVFSADLPASDGVFGYEGNLRMGDVWNVGTKKLVLLVDGTFEINEEIHVASGGSFVAINNNGIGVDKNMEVLGESGSFLQGFFVTDSYFYSAVNPNTQLIPGTGSSRLVIDGGVIAGALQFGRDLGADNSTTPGELFRFDVNQAMNTYPGLWQSKHTWEEIAPQSLP